MSGTQKNTLNDFLSISAVSEALLEKYNTSGPRYTSYPTAPMWQDSYGPKELTDALSGMHPIETGPMPVSLYVHLPFCEERCLFCSCNVVITRQKEQAEKYLDYLFREIEAGSILMDSNHQVVQFHFGGGTPTYLSLEQLQRLFGFLRQKFTFAPDAEIAIEVDPRVTTAEQVALLKELGFNRISMGVQDFDPAVQQAINRIQPVAMTEALFNKCRQLGFTSINFDLIYGLPHQTVETFSKTLAEVIRINPDRIALYNFAYVPWMSPHHKEIPENSLPPGAVKFQIFSRAIQTLTQAGYVYIGMDHFAKPTDELRLAQDEGTLHRNFMGYTTKAGTQLYGVGVSAISGLYRDYAQNWRKLSQYYEAIDQGMLPTMRGYVLTADDLLRRAVISAILCNGRVSFSEIENEYKIVFDQYFVKELATLRQMTDDDLLCFDAAGFTITPLGRIFARNIAMIFDAYLKQKQSSDKPVFSKTL
jgi:oxygen-independent coproporphyrinogen III oxidase